MSGWEAMQQGSPDPFFPEQRRRGLPQALLYLDFNSERFAKMMRVPYWILDPSLSQPRWSERPIWRLRAVVWARGRWSHPRARRMEHRDLKYGPLWAFNYMRRR